MIDRIHFLTAEEIARIKGNPRGGFVRLSQGDAWIDREGLTFSIVTFRSDAQEIVKLVWGHAWFQQFAADMSPVTSADYRWIVRQTFEFSPNFA